MKTIRLWIWACCFYASTAITAQVTQQVTAIQYYYNTDPGVGIAGNGAILNVTPAGDVNQTFSFSLPASLTGGIHQLYVRCKDEFGRWSPSERRLFYVSDIVSGTNNLVKYQYFFDTDPGVGVAGTGGVVDITSTAEINANIAIALPGLSDGFHQLYIRVKDDQGRWSIAERRLIYVSELALGTRNIVMYQYYFNTDPGVGIAGNGGLVPVASTSEINTTISIALPTLSNGFHQLYIRAKDDLGRWSVIERRSFFISPVVSGPKNIIAYQYFVDTDPGVGVAGSGGIVAVPSTADFNSTLALPLPSLSKGIHQLYLRTKDEAGRWSLAERRMFYVTDVENETHDLIALEYFFDMDPGVGSANPFPISTTSDFNQTIDLGVPCLSTGTHYLYIRGKDTANRWSIIERDTFTVASGIAPSVVTPAGPLTICEGSSVVLSTTPVTGVSYQWVESGIPIQGETDPSLTVTSSGSYNLQTTCEDSVLSNVVEVSVTPVNTYYADADNDGYGNSASTYLDCTQPTGYVTNDDDCDDSNAAIHPNAPENCNLIDDDCDGEVDEGVQAVFYADADNDGFGNSSVATSACTAPSGYVTNNSDCDDQNAAINPAAIESCNETDDDCDGQVDEGVQTVYYADADNDGFGNASNFVMACTPPAGYVTNGDDCNDADTTVNPIGIEVCNGIDDDCDELIDDDDPNVFGQFTWYADGDNDGYGDPQVSEYSCTPSPGYVGTGTDCSDTNALIYPGAAETLDSLDNDCDGLTDEGLNTISVDAGDCEVVYFGYAPEACQTLTVTVEGGTAPYSYAWSHGATTSTTNVCPEVTTIYTVVVTDQNGFTAEDNITVQVIDVTCGNSNNKVLVCHIPPDNPDNAHVICITPSAIPDHLAHGCYVGVCDAPDPCEGANQSMLIENSHIDETIGHHQQETVSINRDPEISFVLKPNPADDYIELETNFSEGIISIIDVSGKVVLRQVVSGNKNIINTGELMDGIYFLRIQSGADCLVRSIVVMH